MIFCLKAFFIIRKNDPKSQESKRKTAARYSSPCTSPDSHALNYSFLNSSDFHTKEEPKLMKFGVNF